jgi:hypothetical protein
LQAPVFKDYKKNSWGKEQQMLKLLTDGDAISAVEMLKSKNIDVERNPRNPKKIKFKNDFERKKALDLLYTSNLSKSVV